MKHFFFYIKLNILRVELLTQHLHKNFTTNLGGKLFKVGKKVILDVSPDKSQLEFTTKIYCESCIKMIIFNFILAEFKKHFGLGCSIFLFEGVKKSLNIIFFFLGEDQGVHLNAPSNM